jgi:hypothetical protein
MRNIVKKIALIMMVTLFIGLNASFGEEEVGDQGQTVLLDKGEREQDVLFKYMRDYEFLRMLSHGCSDERLIPMSDLNGKLNDYFIEQFWVELDRLKEDNLQIAEKLVEAFCAWLRPASVRGAGFYFLWNLKHERREFSDLSRDIGIYDWISRSFLSMHSIDYSSMRGYFLRVVKGARSDTSCLKEFSEVFKGVDANAYPAIVNLIYSLDAFLSDLNELRGVIDGEMTNDEIIELARSIFTNELVEYKRFIEENRKVVEKIEELANDGFRVEIEVMEEKCGQFRGRKVCTVKKQWEPIRSIAEIVPHAQKSEIGKRLRKGEL